MGIKDPEWYAGATVCGGAGGLVTSALGVHGPPGCHVGGRGYSHICEDCESMASSDYDEVLVTGGGSDTGNSSHSKLCRPPQ